MTPITYSLYAVVLNYIARHGIGIVAGVKFFHACCFATFVTSGPPKRYGKVRDYPKRPTGYARLVHWVEKLRHGREVIGGPAAPFRVVLLEDERLNSLLDYVAAPEHSIGIIDILTSTEVMALTAKLGHLPGEGGLTAEFVARLSVERRDFGEWVGELELG